jgi:uncharacterized protein (DUF433 family)
MASLDCSQCHAVESIPDKRSGAWVFRGTRTPVSTVFENLQDMTMEPRVLSYQQNLAVPKICRCRIGTRAMDTYQTIRGPSCCDSTGSDTGQLRRGRIPFR